MDRHIEIKIYDSCCDLPECRWKGMIVDFEKEFAVKTYAVFAYIQDEMVGFMRVLRNPDNVCEWYTCDVHVSVGYRRQGIAIFMYEKAIEVVSEYYRATNIMASISAMNTASVQLHEKIGFIPSGIKSRFAHNIFEEDETMYYYWLAKLYPAKNVPVHIEKLFPMWKKYMIEIGEADSDIKLLDALKSRINLSEVHDNIFFEIIWSGNNVIGFAFYSIDGGIKDAIPSGYGYIMEFFILPEWRNKYIGSRCVKNICEKLKNRGCPQVYLTSVPASEEFWRKNKFVKSDLIDLDNQLFIWLKGV